VRASCDLRNQSPRPRHNSLAGTVDHTEALPEWLQVPFLLRESVVR